MKKAKIMLMSIAVIATVGSALAFKVNKVGNTTYCYLETTIQPEQGECTQTITSKAQPTGSSFYFYTEKGTANCSSLTCTKTALGFFE